MSKVFEKIIYYQLYDYLQENRLLNTYQSGFRSMHSTTTALLETTNNWSINIYNGLLNGVLFIDLKKAFDTIDHEIILRNLRTTGLIQMRYDFLHPTYVIDPKNALLTQCRSKGDISRGAHERRRRETLGGLGARSPRKF